MVISMNKLYILDEKGIPKVERNKKKWTQWFIENDQKRRVLRTELNNEQVIVSTVFLAVDHSFGESKPLLYETIVFPHDLGILERYHTKEEAIEGHKKIVRDLKDKN